MSYADEEVMGPRALNSIHSGKRTAKTIPNAKTEKHPQVKQKALNTLSQHLHTKNQAHQKSIEEKRKL